MWPALGAALVLAAACSSVTVPPMGEDATGDAGAPPAPAPRQDGGARDERTPGPAIELVETADARVPTGTPGTQSPDAIDAPPLPCRVVDADVLGGSGCAVTDDGLVYCWGDDSMRQLGTELAPDRCAATIGGEETALPCSLLPMRVEGLVDIVDVAVAPGRACALERGGRVWCWGSNQAHLLGTEVETICDNPFATEPSHATRVACSATPVLVEGIEHATQIAAWGRTCALEESGQVKCWGYDYAVATAVPGVEGAVKVAGSCALLASGGVRCWGPNESGLLGTLEAVGDCDGPYNDPCSVAGVAVALEQPSIDVSSGWQHACAVIDDGSLRCWGHAGYGQLGRPAADSPTCASGFPCELLPLEVPELRGVRRVFAGIGSTCALTDEGRALCWGNLPDSHVTSAPPQVPREIQLPARVASIANERSSACFVLEDGELYCFGLRYERQAGVGVLSPNPTPTRLCQPDAGE